MKRAIVVGSLSLVLITLLFFVFRGAFKKEDSSSPLAAVPDDVPVFFVTDDLSKAITKFNEATYLADLSHSALLFKFNSIISELDSLFKSDPDFDDFFNARQTVVTLSMTKADAFELLFIFDFSDKKSSELKNLFESKSNDDLIFSERTFKSFDLYDLNFSKSKMKITTSVERDLLFMSSSSLLLENSLLELDEKKATDDNQFMEVKEKLSGESGLQIFIQYDEFTKLAPLLFNRDQVFITESLKHFASWTGLDLVFETDQIAFNGYTNYADSSNSLLSSFSQSPQEFEEVTNVLPYNTSMMFYYGTADVKTYFDKMMIRDPELNENFSCYSSWLGNEWCFFMTEPFDSTFGSETFLLVKTTDSIEAIKCLSEISFADSIVVENYQGFRISETSDRDLMNLFFSNRFLELDNPFYAFIDQYVLFANSKSNLKVVIERYRANQTLAKNENFLKYAEHISNSSNLFVYINTFKTDQVIAGLLSKALHSKWKSNPSLGKFSPLTIQFSSFKNLFFTSGSIQYAQENEEENQLVWKCDLDSTVSYPAQIVKNHKTNELEVFVQDDANNIYLIDKTGKILWKKKIEGRIMGDVQQIDMLNNKKLQLCFNTQRFIYVVDRNGEYVAPFPLRLKSYASNSVMTTYYDANKDYRFFIACEGGNIYGFDESGNLLEGWNPKKVNCKITNPILYNNYQGLDYLIAYGNSNSQTLVYVLDRKGQGRSTAPFALEYPLNNSLTILNYDGTPVLISVDDRGYLRKISLDGIDRPISNNFPNQFSELMSDEDSTLEIIFKSQNEISVYSDTSMQWNFSSPDSISGSPFLINLTNSPLKKIGFVSSSTNKIYLLDTDGKLYPEFPLHGSTEFQVGDLLGTGENILVVGEKQGSVLAYRIE